jgi:small conductance mechanosensitive channel
MQKAPLNLVLTQPEQQEAITKFKSLDFADIQSNEAFFLAGHYGGRVLLLLLFLFFAWVISAWIARILRTSLNRMHFDATLTKFLVKLVRWGLMLLVGLGVLGKFGIQTTSFAAVIAAAGLAIGLALQGTLSNFAAGAMLLAFRPYKVGDVIKTQTQTGKVDEIDLFTTHVDTFDNRRIIIPNKEVFGSVIENLSFHTQRRVDVDVGVSYDADIDQARKILLQAVGEVPDILSDPEPAVILSELGSSSVNWSIRVWVDASNFLAVKQTLIRAIKLELDRANIDIPYPYMNVNLQQSADQNSS